MRLRRVMLAAVCGVASIALASPALGATPPKAVRGHVVMLHTDALPPAGGKLSAPSVMRPALQLAGGHFRLLDGRAGLQAARLLGHPAVLSASSLHAAQQGPAPSSPSLLLLGSAGALGSAASIQAAKRTLGVHTLAVVLVNFADDTSEPFTPAEARTAIFTGADSTAAFVQASSYGKMTLTGRDSPSGDVYGWVTIPASHTSCDTSYATTWTPLARTAVEDAGGDLDGYDYYLFIFPSTDCQFSGSSTIGGDTAWSNGSLRTFVTALVLGHLFGATHSGIERCTDPSGAPVAYGATCTFDDFGDQNDLMGGYTYGHEEPREFSAYHRAQFGWLSDTNIETATSGTFVVRPLESLTTGTQLLEVPTEDGWTYVIDFRQPDGTDFDDYATGDPATTGASIRIVAPLFLAFGFNAIQEQAIDGTPDTTMLGSGWADAALPVGATFTDARGHVALTVTAVDPAGVTVEVRTVGDVTPPTAPTTLSATTSGQSAQLAWGAATDDVGVAGYRIYRDGRLEATTPATSYLDPGAALSRHVYVVRAVDAAGNTSTAPPPVSSTPDTQAPSTPGALNLAYGEARYMTLTWDASTDDVGVASYRVSRTPC